MQRGRGVFWCGFRRDPPSRLANRRGFFGGQSGEVVWKIPAFVVYLVDALLVVFRRAKKICPLLRLRLIPANRRDFTCMLGASIFFPTPSLIARSWRGTGVYPREDNPAVPVSLRLPIPSGISSRGLHAPGVSPPGLPAGVARAGFGV